MGAEVILFIAMFGSIFGIAYMYFSTRHKERMALIENGADASLFNSPPQKSYWALKIALLLMGIGVGILAGNLLDTYTRMEDEVCYLSMVAFFGGLGLLSGFYVGRKMVISDSK